MNGSKTIKQAVLCEKCERPMKWDCYTLAHRPDILRQSDKRAPISWAWHCRCGMWEYQTPGPVR